MTAPQTISPLIPALRFPQFANADAWQVVRLGEVCESVASGRNKTKLLEGAFPVFGSTGIIGYTNDPVYDYCSIIVARVGANAGMINIATGRYDVSDNAIIIQLKDVNLFFVYYYLTITNLNKIAFGSGQPLITATQLKQLPLPLPTLPEQQKIASCLSSLDEYISLTKKKLDLLKLHKKGLLQNLFPKKGGTKPKFRFKGFEDEWKVVKLCEVAERITRKNKENNQNILTISAQYGLINQSEYFNKNVASVDVTNYYLIYKDEFAYNKSRSQGYEYGAIKPLRKYDKGVVSTLYICFKVKDIVCNQFIEHYFEAGLFNRQIGKIAQEGARNHGLLNISADDFFENTCLVLPSLPEQKQIASCLSSIDDEIARYDERIKAMEEHKKGLMQRLFPKIG